MALDSAAKRKAAQGLPFIPTPSIPDGTIDADDRANLAGVYGGLLEIDGEDDNSLVVKIGRAMQDRRARYSFA